MPNRLAGESSPYLLQHQHNPVDWYPWAPEALERARREERPIFLSIGYSACHWCHVMEHESFENERIAGLLNERFVCIKVDREERPDLDQLYMNAVQLLTGRGGWPMSVFLTPDLRPFYGGTYWPPTRGRGMPGFDEIVLAVDDAWRNRRQAALDTAEELTNHLAALGPRGSDDGAPLEPGLLRQAATRLERVFDFRHGGFGQAPKFPHPMDLQVLLRVRHRDQSPGLLEMVRLTLDKMARGGIYDHLGGGFARYSVDERWLVPHFEKMLYDNALLAGAYLDGYLVSGDESYARIVRETLDYVLRDLTDPAGGFHSTEDADSEGEEGKFYVWTPAEIHAVLGPERGARFCYVYDVSPQGNFEHHNILNLPKPIAQCAGLHGWDLAELEAELAASRRALWEVRERRVRPGKDDKVLVSWNGLFLDSLSRAAAVFDEPRYLAAAQRAATFLLSDLRRADGRLLHTWRRGVAKLDAYLDDYACLANGLVSLYEADFDERWIDAAVQFAETMLTRFEDREQGGFYFTADDHERLLLRSKDLHDSSVPSGNSMAATVLMRLGKLCGRTDFVAAAERTLQMAANELAETPHALGQMLIAADMFFGPFVEIAAISHDGPTGPTTRPLLTALHRRYAPNRVVASRAATASVASSSPLASLFAGRSTVNDEPTAYVCRDHVCEAPVVGGEAICARWAGL